MGIREGAGPEWRHPGGPAHCIGRLPPLPQIGGRGTQRQGPSAYSLIYAVPVILQWPMLADRWPLGTAGPSRCLGSAERPLSGWRGNLALSAADAHDWFRRAGRPNAKGHTMEGLEGGAAAHQGEHSPKRDQRTIVIKPFKITIKVA